MSWSLGAMYNELKTINTVYEIAFKHTFDTKNEDGSISLCVNILCIGQISEAYKLLHRYLRLINIPFESIQFTAPMMIDVILDNTTKQIKLSVFDGINETQERIEVQTYMTRYITEAIQWFEELIKAYRLQNVVIAGGYSRRIRVKKSKYKKRLTKRTSV
jgi:hypothetical protein